MPDAPTHRRRGTGRPDRGRPPARARPATPLVAWSAAVVLLVVSAVLGVDASRDALALRRSFGESVTVWVLRDDVAPGATLDGDDVRARPLPRALVPAGAVAGDDGTPVGRTARDRMFAGEVVLDGRLAAGGRTGAAAGLHDGELAVALPAGRLPPARPGDPLVLVLTTGVDGLDGAIGSDGASGTATATGALVDARTIATLDDGGLLVAVAADDAAGLAGALRAGEVLVTLAAG